VANALELLGIRKSFDGFLALDGAHVNVRWGEVHALLGENGAGKSSLMNIAAGLYAPEVGELLVNDNPVRFRGPRDAAREGIGMVHQHFKLVRPFTVAENVLLAQDDATAGAGGHAARLKDIEVRLQARAAALGFAIDPRQRIDRLSVAEQQRVEILKVLLAGARILILDEPTAVLTDQEAERLLVTIRMLASQGAAVVLVTHKMSDVKAYADRVTVMRGGRTVATLDPSQTPVEELVRLTVGTHLAAPERSAHARGTVQLRLRGVHMRAPGAAAPLLNDIHLDVHAGEIYGIAGVGGNGQGELAAAIMGLANGVSGSMVMADAGELRPSMPAQRRDLGMAAIPADRQAYALASSLSVAENFGIGQVHAGRYGPLAWLRRRRLHADTRAAVEAFDVQGVRATSQKAALLSGGNAQKLVIAREFSKSPRFLLVHSPSRGLDVRASAEVHRRLLAARAAGTAVLLISEDLDEVMRLSDRIGVMAQGRIVAEFAQPADRQAVGQAMVDHV
jgi:simple sugar transport system ATP-binding protein